MTEGEIRRPSPMIHRRVNEPFIVNSKFDWEIPYSSRMNRNLSQYFMERSGLSRYYGSVWFKEFYDLKNNNL